MSAPSVQVEGEAAGRTVAGSIDVPATCVARRVYRVALTGGPCSGKSSSLASFTKALTSRGFDVYALPEAPTILMEAGFPYPGLHAGPLLLEFERALATMQLQMEDSAERLARARDELQRGRPAVLFYDRGLTDMKGYMSATLWAQLLAELGVSEDAVMARYDLVIHLETSAINAEAFYTLANNPMRTEGLEEARVNDARVKEAWTGHANWVHVPNRVGAAFASKLEEATAAVLRLVGL
jgi:predicted ATPase